eukprot:GEMP01023925.1.p1 GENE.GEMP01023925.1~~GEMP01023925.1.p1  ORF type:complete len:395 (+),score=63.54 GEMP01023925.1:54-1238(+)
MIDMDQDEQQMYELEQNSTVDVPGTVVYNSQGYPKREGLETCSFFVKNGQCKFGTTCKWHHPEFIYPSVDFNSRGFPIRPDATECEFYSKTQECKFGCTCKYNHPEPEAPKSGLFQPIANVQVRAMGVNSMGYPRRPGAQPCAYFMKSGQCKFAQSCKFDHPDKPGMMPMGMVNMQPQFAPMGASVAVNPLQQMAMQQNVIAEAAGFNSKGFPIRPGVAVCQFFSKTGDCKFGPSCKWDHNETQGGMMMMMNTPRPQMMAAPSGGAPAGINSLGLPIRPASQACPFFTKTGSCSYGESCKWDHPEEYCALAGNNSGMGAFPNKRPVKVETAQGFNSLGFPLRPGQGPCSFYMKTGSCSYGNTCKWDHPEGLGGTQPGFQKTIPTPTAMMRSTPY